MTAPIMTPIQVGIAMLEKNSHSILKIVDAFTNHSPITVAPIKLIHVVETFLVFVSHLVSVSWILTYVVTSVKGS